MDINNQNIELLTESQRSTRRISAAVGIILSIALVGWFIPDGIAWWQASTLYESLDDFIKECKRTRKRIYPTQVSNHLGREPSNSYESTDEQQRDEYVFEGLDKVYTVRAEYLFGVLVKIELESARKL
jgi:hypothetical protein